MPYCPLCEKKFDTRKGLQGHFRFKHKFEIKQSKPAKETVLTEAIGRSIDRRISGEAVMKAMEGEKRERRNEKEEEVENGRGVRENEGHRFLFVEKEKVGLENGKEVGENRGHRFSFVE